MELIQEKTFRNEAVTVDNTQFENCVFSGVTLVFGGKGLPNFVECQFKNITLQFEDSAANTLKFLGGIYGTGITPAVDKIIDGVRNKKF